MYYANPYFPDAHAQAAVRPAPEVPLPAGQPNATAALPRPPLPAGVPTARRSTPGATVAQGLIATAAAALHTNFGGGTPTLFPSLAGKSGMSNGGGGGHNNPEHQYTVGKDEEAQ